MLRTMLFLLMIVSSRLAYGDVSLGSIASNMTEPIEIVSGFVSVGCLIVGIACFFAALVKYIEHRKNPLAVPIGTVIWLLLIGLALVGLPFIYIITGNGIPFTVLWGGGT